MTLLYILYAIGILGSYFPLLPSDHWVFRSQDYLKFYYLLLNILVFILGLILFELNIINSTLLLLALITIIYLLKIIIPFTSMYKSEVVSCFDADSSVSIFIYNVLQKNERYENLVNKIKELKPDIVFLCETNQAWKNNIKEVYDMYPYYVDKIREDTYGIITLSKYECLEGGINEFVTSKIPSTEMLLKIGKKQVRIFGLHPKPPVPSEAVYATKKDKELQQLADYIYSKKNNEHYIVVGDLNDVAWSKATKNFRSKTDLLDPRIGRSFYPTFPTHFPLKIPLDHVFCSRGMQIQEFTVLENLGSDHYPLFVKIKIT